MIYNIHIFDLPVGWIKKERTNDYSRLIDLRKQALEKAVECMREMERDFMKGHHFVYYFELPENRFGETDVYVYMHPYMCDDDTFQSFIDDSKPIYCGAFHK
jgi:hypothetical protein